MYAYLYENIHITENALTCDAIYILKYKYNINNLNLIILTGLQNKSERAIYFHFMDND